MEQLEAVRAELARSSDLPAYEALDVVWVAVIKVANLLSGDSEHRRLIALLNRLPEDSIRPVLQQKGVDVLLNLDPPLESVLTSPPHERLAADRTVRELAVVREKRGKEPREALRNLTEVLKRVRNRRAHGFKTPDDPRDLEILRASADILRNIGETAIHALRLDPPTECRSIHEHR
jgi:hypothetical protein